MKKQLFTTAPIQKSSYNAIVGEHNNPRYAYINGYYEAAKILADTALKSSSKNILFYPICFNYRHYVELHLKSLIELTEELYLKMELLGYAKGVLHKTSEKNLDEVHSIEVLFGYFEKRLNLVTVNNEVFDTNIRKYIMQLHSIDSDGQIFRYHLRTNKQESFPASQQYDLKNISDRMEEVNKLLFGVDTWIDHYIEISDSMISEMNEYMKNTY